MNKMELAEKIAAKIGVTKTQAEEALNAFVSVTTDELKKGGEVTLTGFGAFSARKRKGREGINPRNPAEKITIPSVVVAKFKAGKNLKEELKKSGEQLGQTKPVETINSAETEQSQTETPTAQ